MKFKMFVFSLFIIILSACCSSEENEINRLSVELQKECEITAIILGVDYRIDRSYNRVGFCFIKGWLFEKEELKQLLFIKRANIFFNVIIDEQKQKKCGK